MRFRLDFTVRMDGLECDSCHYCEDLAAVNRALEKLETRGAWGFSIHALPEEER